MTSTSPATDRKPRALVFVAAGFAAVVFVGAGVAIGLALGDNGNKTATSTSTTSITTTTPTTTAPTTTAAPATTVPPPPAPLVSPTDVKAEARCDSVDPARVLCDIMLTWTDTNSGESGYRVIGRSSIRGDFTVDLAPNSTSWTGPRWDTGDDLFLQVVAVRGSETAAAPEVEVSTGIG